MSCFGIEVSYSYPQATYACVPRTTSQYFHRSSHARAKVCWCSGPLIVTASSLQGSWPWILGRYSASSVHHAHDKNEGLAFRWRRWCPNRGSCPRLAPVLRLWCTGIAFEFVSSHFQSRHTCYAEGSYCVLTLCDPCRCHDRWSWSIWRWVVLGAARPGSTGLGRSSLWPFSSGYHRLRISTDSICSSVWKNPSFQGWFAPGLFWALGRKTWSWVAGLIVGVRLEWLPRRPVQCLRWTILWPIGVILRRFQGTCIDHSLWTPSSFSWASFWRRARIFSFFRLYRRQVCWLLCLSTFCSRKVECFERRQSIYFCL